MNTNTLEFETLEDAYSQGYAMLPDSAKDEHKLCSICKDDDVVVVIQGGSPRQGTKS